MCSEFMAEFSAMVFADRTAKTEVRINYPEVWMNEMNVVVC